MGGKIPHKDISKFIRVVEDDVFKPWFSESMDLIAKVKENQVLQAQEHKEKKMKLEKIIAGFQVPVSEELFNEQRASIDALTKEIERFSITLKKTSEDSAKEKENIEKDELVLQQRSKDVQLKEGKVDLKLEKFAKGIRYFEENLALKIKRFPDSHLKFIFTCLDASNPSREFSFGLTVEESPGVYRVKDCDPPIDSVHGFLAELNKTNNLKTFLLQMRAEFRSIVSKLKK